MKKPSTLTLVVLSALPLGVFGFADAEQATPAPVHYFSLNYNDIAWQKIVPGLGDDSPEIAILRVDPRTGATHLLIRNPRKIHVPRHWHSANETHTILAGTMVFECEGKIDVLGPGSFNYIPSKSIHQAWLPDGGLLFITVDAPWDINWVEGPPTRGNIGVEPPLAPTSEK